MKIKERKQDNFFLYLKKGCSFLWRLFFNNKTRKLYKTIFVMGFLLIGFVFGLIASGYFGTFDQPSGRVYALLSAIGVDSLHDLKVFTEGLVKQNIKIPYNFIVGKFSNPERLTIDIGFEDYQRIAYKRQQALELGILISSGEDFVPATITYDGKVYDVKLRLKGDLPDHWNGDKWSLRVNVKGEEKIMSMDVFSIQNPATRQEVNEMIYQRALQLEGVIGLRYKFVEVIINGENKGIYALEEHFSKELIENNDRREGVILKFDEGPSFEKSAKRSNVVLENMESFYASQITTFENEENVLNNSIKSAQFEKGRNLLESLRSGDLAAHEVFDVEKIAKYYAISTLMNCPHSKAWHNSRIYYNPITSLLEPIGFDGNCRRDGSEGALKDYTPDCVYLKGDSSCSLEPESFSDLILSDGIIFEKYMEELHRVSQKEYLDNLFSEIDSEIKRAVDIIHKDNAFYYFSKNPYYVGQNQLREMLNPLKGVNSYFIQGSGRNIVLSIGNINPLPIEIINVDYGENTTLLLNQESNILQPWNLMSVPIYENFEFKYSNDMRFEEWHIFNFKVNYNIFGLDNLIRTAVLPWSSSDENFLEKDFIRQKSNLSDFEFLEVNGDTSTILFKGGEWKLNKDIIIPEGFIVIARGDTTIDLVNGSMILSYSELNFKGNSENLIRIISSDGTGQGVAVFNVEEESYFENVIFNNLTNPSKSGWELSGAITFNEAPFVMKNVLISGMNAEDSLDVVSSQYNIEDSNFEYCLSDCVDDDFGWGAIENTTFNNCGNDCLDFSGAEVFVKNVNLFNVGDKGLSAGERSVITVENLSIEGEVNIAIASKDLSEILLDGVEISNATYAFALYQKKAEYGPAIIEAINTNINDLGYIVEKGSSLSINNLIILSDEKNVYEKLYGGN